MRDEHFVSGLRCSLFGFIVLIGFTLNTSRASSKCNLEHVKFVKKQATAAQVPKQSPLSIYLSILGITADLIPVPNVILRAAHS